MKGSFITAFLCVECFLLLTGFSASAQQAGKLQSVIGGKPVSGNKNNFTSFTRKYTLRGKEWTLRNKAFLSHPDAHFDDTRSPDKNAVEIFEKRTINSKYFVNTESPSVFYARKSSSPLHFKKNGQWITIDARLGRKGPMLYEASNQEDPLGFDMKSKSSYIVTPAGKTSFNDWKLYGKKGGAETLLATANWTLFSAGDDGIRIKNIFPGIDAEMKVSRGSVKTNFIIHANRFSAYKLLLFRDSFKSGQAGNFTFSNGHIGNGLISPVDFKLGTAALLHVKEGVMYQKVNPSSNKFIPYFIEQNKLTLAINSDTLSAMVKKGDVIIDPLVQDVGVLSQNNIQGSQLNPDCSLTVPCQYNLTVPAPPGAQLMDAQFSFEFTAFDPCVGQDGAFSFIINGGCTSQLYAGTSAGPGPQTFPNQSIQLQNGASIADCFPAPVCNNQDIPFTFNFFRSCKGPDGCDGSCIAASQDLQITLVGRTFDSASLSISPQSACAGSPVTLTARGYYGVPPYDFTWLLLPQFNGDSVIQVNPSISTVYTVSVTDACKAPLGLGLPILKSVTATVSKLPTPVFTSNSPVCAGGQLILSAPAVTGTTYFMENASNGLGSGQYSSSAVFNNVTTAYSGKWIAVASDGNGCTSDTASTQVVVNPTPAPTVTITSSATSICAGGTVTFTASATNAGSSASYQWLLNGANAGTNNPVYSGNSFANNDAVSCVVTAGGPCAGGSAMSNTIVLTVNAPAGPPIVTISSSATSICAGGTVNFTASATNAGSSPSYQWQLNAVNVGANSPLYSGSNFANNDAVSCVVTAGGPCAGGSSVSNTIVLTVNATGAPTATITSSANNICTGGTVTFTASAINAGSSPSYQWLLNGGKVGTNNPQYSGNNFVNNDAVSCVVSANGPCVSGFDVSNTIVLTVSASGSPTFDPIGPLCQNSIPPPLPSISKEGITGTWSPATINTSAFGTKTYTFTPFSSGNCSAPASINITIASSITPTFPTIANTYCQLSVAPALPSTSKEGINGTWNPASISTAVAGSTLYTFTASAGQCGTSLQTTIVINPSPTLTMGPDVTITPGASTPLVVTVTGNISSYQWEPVTGLDNATIKNPVASPPATTVYTLVVTDENQCEDSGSIRVTVAGVSSKILVPNAFSPNNDGINDTWVISNLSAYPGATVDVFNRYGEPVFHSENYSKPWDGNYHGKPLPVATYYYIIDLKNNQKKIAGSVTIFK